MFKDRQHVKKIVHEIFVLSFILLILFIVLEIVKPKMVQAFVPLLPFAIAVIIVGIVSMYLQHEDRKNKN